MPIVSGKRRRPSTSTGKPVIAQLNYRKRGSASYIVREVREVCERERERYRKRETDGSNVTSVALKLAMSFALFLAKICTLVSPLLNGAEFTLSVAKNVALFETVPILRNIRTLRLPLSMAA